MKIDNLSVGQVVKNYKELCEVLDVKYYKGGDSKKSQLNELERYIKYRKSGNSFIIDEIYKNPLPSLDGRQGGNNSAPYLDDIELLLIDLLLSSDYQEVKIPTSALLQLLKMVNFNYYRYFSKRNELSQDFKVSKVNINDYYESVHNMLSGALKSVINRLVSKHLIVYKKITIIKYAKATILETIANGDIKVYSDTSSKDGYSPSKININEYYREADNDDEREILRIEREIYLQLGMRESSNFNDLIRKGLLDKFKEIRKKRLKDEMNIISTHVAHHMIFNEDHLQDEKRSIIESMEKKGVQMNMINSIKERIINNSVKRQNDAIIDIFESEWVNIDTGEFKEDLPRTLDTRSNINYIDEMNKMNDILLTYKNNEYKFKPIQEGMIGIDMDIVRKMFVDDKY